MVDVRSKYVDEVFRRWFIFGQSRDGLTVDVSDGGLDVFEHIPCEAAEEFIKAKDGFVDEIERLLNKYPGSFNTISDDYRKFR